MLPMSHKTPISQHAAYRVLLRTGRSDVLQLLRELYVDQGKSQEATAAEMGVSRMTVVRWLRQYGIDRPEIVA